MCDGRARQIPVKMPQRNYSSKTNPSSPRGALLSMNDVSFIPLFAALSLVVLVRQVAFFTTPLMGLRASEIIAAMGTLFPAALAGPLLGISGCVIFLSSAKNVSPGFLRFLVFLLVAIRCAMLVPLPTLNWSEFTVHDDLHSNPYANAQATSHAELPDGTGERWTVNQCAGGVCDSDGENASTPDDGFGTGTAQAETDEDVAAKEAAEERYSAEQEAGESSKPGDGDSKQEATNPSVLDWMAGPLNPVYSMFSKELNDGYKKFVSAKKVYGRDMRSDGKGHVIPPTAPSTALVPLSGPFPDSLTEEGTGRIIIHHSPHFHRFRKMVSHGKQYPVPAFKVLTVAAIFVLLFCGRHFPQAATALGHTSAFLLSHGLKYFLVAGAVVALVTTVVVPLFSAAFMEMASSCFASLLLASMRKTKAEVLDPEEQVCRNWILALAPNFVPGVVFGSLGALLTLWTYHLALSSLKFALCSAVARSLRPAEPHRKPTDASISGISVIASDVRRGLGSLALVSLVLAVAQGGHWTCDALVFFNRVHPYIGLVLTLLGDIPLSFLETFFNCLVIPLLAISDKSVVGSTVDGLSLLLAGPLSVLTLLISSMALHWLLLPLAMSATSVLVCIYYGGFVSEAKQGLSGAFLVLCGPFVVLSSLASVVTSVSWAQFIWTAQEGKSAKGEMKGASYRVSWAAS